MTIRCGCPRSLNITVGIFLIFLGILSFFNVWGVFMPTWLALICLILGLMTIILNSVIRVQEKGKHLTAEQANQIHAREGY